MPHSPEDKKRALSRVRRIRGQVEALERALESGEPCMTILQQIASIRGGGEWPDGRNGGDPPAGRAGQRRHHP